MNRNAGQHVTLTAAGLGMFTFAGAGVLSLLRLVSLTTYVCAASAGVLVFGSALIAGGDRGLRR